MQQEANNTKQVIVDRLKQSSNILVAVSANPSVDALSGALALSLMLNKMEKHATAVFSGKMPPAMAFLNPTKTFESSVDALRDFIISLDKEKADRLRYKVEDDAVRIFITPYRTTITEKDLQFSQGDFNVDLIVALGVEKREDLDAAIVAHGRILHDATIVTINANNQRSSLGLVDLHDPNASSLCELLMGISESFQQPNLIDAQISTALLTGIVAATERFSNEHTTPRVMTMAAQLMASGANQQLIATNLQKENILPPDLAKPQPIPAAQSTAQAATVPKKADGELEITHESVKEETPKTAPETAAASIEAAQTATEAAEQQLAAALPNAAAATEAFDELKNQLESAAPEAPKPPQPERQQQPRREKRARRPKDEGTEIVSAETPEKAEETEKSEYLSSHGSWKGRRLEPPTMGSALSATAEQALDDSKRAEEEDRNKTLLNHFEPAAKEAPTPSEPQPEAPAGVVPVVEQLPSPPVPEVEPEPIAPPAAPQIETPPKIEEPQAPPAPELPAEAPFTPPAPEPATQNNEALDKLQEAATSAAEAAASQAPPAPEPKTPAELPVTNAPVDLDAARQAVSSALEGQPVVVLPNASQNQPAPPADLTQLPPAPEPTPFNAADLQSGGMPALPPLPPLPPMPDLPQTDASGAPAMPPIMPEQAPLPPVAPLEAPQPASNVTPPVSNDPGQFRIPGQ